MTNFQSLPDNELFVPSAFVLAWERALGFSRGFDASSPAERTAILQRLRARTLPLWQRFNVRRDELGKHYMDEGPFLEGYLASFFMPNVQRVFQVLSTGPSVEALRGVLREGVERGILRICDFGSGPLSGSAGLLAALANVAKESGLALSGRALRIRIHAVDRASRAIAAGKGFIEAALPEGVSLEVLALSSLEKVSEPIDVFLGVNVLNELPKKHRLTTARKGFELAADPGLVLWMEPGQDVHARALGKLRNALLDSAPVGISVVAPCLHAGTCPLSGDERPDWCWFRSPWTRPEALRVLDEYSRLEHDELNFSYVLFSKGRPVPKGDLFARVVSDGIAVGALDSPAGRRFVGWAMRNPAPGAREWPATWKAGSDAHLAKTLLCTHRGTLEAVVERGRSTWSRGKLVTEKEVPVRCAEVAPNSQVEGVEDPERRA